MHRVPNHASSGSSRDLTTAHLRKALASTLDRPLHEIDAEAPIELFGLRAILRLTNELERSIGWLPKTLYFECATLSALAQYIVESYPDKLSLLLGREVERAPQAAPRPNGDLLRDPDKGDNIAIVGMACRFAHAPDLHAFWDNLRSGRDCIEEIPATRWDHRRYFAEEPDTLGKTYGKWGSFIDDFDRFDPAFFNISPREAEMMDPQERVFLECSYAAMEDAGYTPAGLRRSGGAASEHPVGVFVGLMFEEYNLFRGDILGSPASIANRISYHCDFRGPSLSVDTMCSSSLTALHLACQSLKRDECRAAIAGGVNLTLHPNKYLMLARLKMASPAGRCKAFGEDARGYVPGEGAAAIILKRLANALADGDHVYGLIQGTAINQAGKTRSYFAPNPRAQAEVVRQALETAGISARLVTCIEAHGTGTSLGDPIEIAGLTNAFRADTDATQYCAVGSVKTNIGHCESAAGIAGLTKILLQLKHGQLVPSLHAERLNPNINLAGTPFEVQRALEAWKRPQIDIAGTIREFPRIAGVSSFGGGGANAHAVIEEYRAAVPASASDDGPAAIVLSARNEDRLRQRAMQLLMAIEQQRVSEHELRDIAYTLQVGREAMECRLGLLASTLGEVRDKLQRYVDGADACEDLYRADLKQHRDLVMAFKDDEDLVQAVEGWLAGRRLPKLLGLWVKGIDIAWTRLYGGEELPRRVSLPTYPFARERYWVEPFEHAVAVGQHADGPPAQGTGVQHPMVQRNRSRVGEQRYTARFSGEEFFLADHVVQGRRILPAVAFLEMARAAIERAWPARPASTVLELRHVVWSRRLVVGEPTEVGVVLRPLEGGEMEFEIYTGGPSQPLVHCHGRAVWCGGPFPGRVDVEHLDRRTDGRDVVPHRFYAGLSQIGLAHGLAFQSLTAIRRTKQDVLARLRLPQVVDGTQGDYLLHPSLVDGALQACATLTEAAPEQLTSTHLPFALESLRAISPCRDEMIAWARLAPASEIDRPVVKCDVDLCDTDGNVCVQLRGFSVRAVPTEREALQAFVPVWNNARCEVRQSTVPDATRVLLVGGAAVLEWVRQTHESVELLRRPASIAIEDLEAALAGAAFDHLLWAAPDLARDENTAGDIPIIGQQEQGVVAVFRIVKALLRAGYGDRRLRWTFVTASTMRVHGHERTGPTHAAIAGLVGSLAKEYPHWDLTLLDVDALDSVSARECLAMPPDKRGQALAHRQGEWWRREYADVPETPQRTESLYRRHGVYVVIGGAGGIGEVWTRDMIERYDAAVIWIGRQPYNTAIAEKIEALGRLGRAPLYVSADATNLEALQHAAEAIGKQYPTIHGVVHSAIVLRDQGIAGMDEAAFLASLAAKVDISVNLDRVFGSRDLDFILFFSSIMSFLTSAGQSNYAAGCAFVDSFAHALQQRRPYAIKTVNWGYWGQVGIVGDDAHGQALARRGIGSIDASEGMAGLRGFMGQALGQLAIVKLRDREALADLTFTETLASAPDAATISFDQTSSAEGHPPEAQRHPGPLAARDACLAELLAATLASLGAFTKDHGRVADLASVTGVAPFYERWQTSSICYLQQEGWLGADLRIAAALRSPDAVWREWEANKAAWATDRQAEMQLLDACLRALPDVLRGRRLATDVLFPQGSMRLVEGIYRGNATADYFNNVLARTLAALIESCGAPSALRILEIGAGTGSTTATLLPLLQQSAIEEYCYSDVSMAFLEHGKQHYAPRFPMLTTARYDVSMPLASQSIRAGHYDVAIAANVLHATPDIRQTVRNVKAALKTRGVLLLNEIGTWSLFRHLTFGLLEGWWLANDTLRVPGSPALAPDTWKELLADEGFDAVAFPAAGAHHLGQQVIVARSDGWARQPIRPSPLGRSERDEVPHTSASTPHEVMAAAREQGGSTIEKSLREASIDYFRKLIAAVLKMPAEQLNAGQSFAAYGLDSILVGQLTYQLRQVFTEVSATLFFEVHSIEELVDHFLTHKERELAAVLSPRGQHVPAPGKEELLSTNIDEISVSETRPNASVEPRVARPAAAEANAAQSFRRADVGRDVAIVGLGGRYPRARTLKEFWRNLADGINCVSEIPSERWNWRAYYDEVRGKPGRIYTKWGGFIDGIDRFDPLFFKISPKEAKRMDPQERLFLQCCYEAIEDAGYTPGTLGDPSRIGVFVGVMNSRYTPQPAHASVANRISYVFDLQGPSLAVDTACSSSLTAVHLALESLSSGTTSCVIVGGVNLIIDPVHYMVLAEMTMLSEGRQCKAFGAQADGLVDAEGVGAIVLKPLRQAERDGDHIYAVIKGSAINAGGRTHGYTVPNPHAQSRLVADALERAGLTADEVSYIEAHGTGTALGDPIEIAGLARAFEHTSTRKQFCAIGSVKSNLGHCESAAGIAGLTKVLLQLKHGQLVPSLHAEPPNPEIDFSQTPFKLQRTLEPWRRPLRTIDGALRESPRVAGISSFGAGGANAHLIVQEYVPSESHGVSAVRGDADDALVVLSARTADQLERKARDLLAFIEDEDSVDVWSLAYTLQVGREAMEMRAGFVVSSVAQLAAELKAWLAGDRAPDSRRRLQTAGGGTLSSLLDAWLAGQDVEWSRLYGEGAPRRISLPTYPFADERYWMESTAPAGLLAEATAPNVLHPLLHRNVSDLRHQCYRSTFTGSEWFLRDHPSPDHKLLTPAVCLEMARAAVMHAVASRRDASVELRDVRWADPLELSLASHLDVVLVPHDSEHEGIYYEIYREQDDQTVVLCQGRAIVTQLPPTRLDLEDVERQVREAGRDQLLARLRLPRTPDASATDYVLHPSLIDSVLQAALNLLDSSADADVAPTPVALRSLRIASPCNRELLAWIRYPRDRAPGDEPATLDIDLCDGTGQVLAEMRGLTWAVSAAVRGGTVSPGAGEPVNAATLATRSLVWTSEPDVRSVRAAQHKPTGIGLPPPSPLTAASSSPSPRIRVPVMLAPAASVANPNGAAPAAVPRISLYGDGSGVFSMEVDAGADGGRLHEALHRAQQEASLKVLLIRGLGHAFARRSRVAHNDAIERQVYRTLISFPYPVIVALDSDAVGAAFLAAALADVMVCSEEAAYGFTDPERGVYPDAPEVMLFGERFGRVHAQDLLMAATAMSGGELRAKGWTCPILPAADVDAHARTLASAMAKKPQEALRLLKQHLARKLSGLVEALRPLETRPAAPPSGVGGGIGIEWSSSYIRVRRHAAHLLVITLSADGAPTELRDLRADLGELFARLGQADAADVVVLTSEHPEVFPGVERASDEDLLAACTLIARSPIPILMLLDRADGLAWLVSLCCDGCVYRGDGVYSSAMLVRRPALASVAASVFMDRFGASATAELLLTAASYSGRDLQQRVGPLILVDGDGGPSTAVGVAESWTSWPRGALTTRKHHLGTILDLEIQRRPVAADVEIVDDPADSALAAPVRIPLRSSVVTVTAYRGGIAVIAMEETTAKNMFSEALIEGVGEAFAHVDATPTYKVVILTGHGGYFASGGTKQHLLAIQAGRATFADSAICRAAMSCRVPVIAAMQGHAIGGGWTLGLFADLVILGVGSRYTSPYMDYGFTPGAGATFILPTKIGLDLARESLLTAQPYTGSMLRQRGLRLSVRLHEEVQAAALALARQIAQVPRAWLVAQKQRLAELMDAALDETYRLELAMHQRTFVGRAEPLAAIHGRFAETIESSAPASVIALSSTDGLPEIAASLKTLLANELQMQERDIPADRQFVDLGLDSIAAVTWIRKINETYRIALDATTVYRHATLSELSRHVEAEVGRTDSAKAEAGPAAVDAPVTAAAIPPPRSVVVKRAPRPLTKRHTRQTTRLAAASTQRPCPIAVIGMAGQFPQARNLDAFWQNIAQCRNCISPVAQDRWDVRAYYRSGEIAAGKSVSRWLGALDDYDRFDPLFFNISPTEAESMDPQQRLFLQACWHAIEDAGYAPQALSGTRCGVFAGCAHGDYHLLSREQQISAQGFTGDATSILAARIAYHLNLQGPCLSIDTACSSSLVALVQACDSLASGATDLALAGGVYVMVGPDLHIKTSQAGMLSPEGRCFSFDQRADGFVPGEGVGVILLKRLADAQRDHDIIAGVVQGWGVNQDGKTNGITAPNPESQTRLEREVYDRFHIDPGNIQLIEAHGTGTKLGDPIEIEGLKNAFAHYTRKTGYCALGSVKSNIGHGATAAGIAGFVKVLLALKHRQLPPTINFERLNEHIELANSPFYVNSRLQAWTCDGATGRQAAISSFGFSGTNAHVVLGEYVAPGEMRPAFIPAVGVARIIPLSARTPEQLDQRVRDLRDFVRDNAASLDLSEMAYTLQIGREAMSDRLGFVASTVEQLEQQLTAYLDGQSRIDGCYREQGRQSRESLSLIGEDEEIRNALIWKWIAAGKLSKLLDMWVRGLAVDWNALYGADRPRRINLPLYPFARERYWIDHEAAPLRTMQPTAALHPLLHRNTSDLLQQRYTSTLTGDEQCLTDHRAWLDDRGPQKVLPGAAYLEMARAAVACASARATEIGALELRDTAWLKPLVVRQPQDLSIALATREDGRIEYEIYTDSDGFETVYCQGHAIYHREAPEPIGLELDHLTRRMNLGSWDSATIYSMFAKMAIEYGESHQAVVRIDHGHGELLAHIRVPPSVEADIGAYLLHPSVLDGALQASIGLLVDVNDLPERPFVPFALACLRILSPCTKEMAAWVRYAGGRADSFDIDLCDLHGNVCVQMHGFSTRVLSKNAVAAFDRDVYLARLTDISNGDLSVEEAVELG